MAYLSFQNTSLKIAENTVKSIKYERCTLCNQKSTVFHCQDCIRNGNFKHSCNRVQDSYFDKKSIENKLNAWLNIREGEIIKLVERKKRKQRLTELICAKHDQIDRIKKTVYVTKRKLKQVSIEDNYYVTCLRGLRGNVPLRSSDLKEMKNQMESSVKENNSMALKLHQLENKNKSLVKNNILDLTKFIFPMTKIEPPVPHSQESMDDDMIMALAEAANTLFERGRWVTEAEKGGAVKIVEQYLPLCGNYDNDAMVSNDEVCRRDCKNICVGLSYLCQLVNVISFYVGVNLPRNIKHSDFCEFDTKDLNESSEFKHSVFKLNANVVFLCISQSITHELIKPLQAAENILLLIKEGDLGRRGSSEFSPILMKKLENLTSMYIDDDDEGNEIEFMLPPDWEALPPLPPSYSDMYYKNSHHKSNYLSIASEAPSLVTSAAASVISLWRGFAYGNKS